MENNDMARAAAPSKKTTPAATLHAAFVTQIYQAPLGGAADLNAALEQACWAIAEEDEAGQAWAEEHAYAGYTSYASLNDLAWRNPAFSALEKALDRHVAAYAEAAGFDLGARTLTCNSLWINILDPDGMHSGHIHPHSVVSGVYYVAVPEGASALRFEDPRLGMMMAAPQRRSDAPDMLAPFRSFAPAPGMVLLWESWLRHEVVANRADDPRVSISFNYGLR
jgi:uncharacterized protein (TIGR02466 family)